MFSFIHRLVLIFLILAGSFLSAQNKKIDSLKSELSSAGEDTLKLKILFRLASLHKKIDPDKSVEYASRGLDLAKKIRHEKYIGKGYIDLAVAFRYKVDYEKCLENLELAKPFLDKTGNPAGLVEYFTNRALVSKAKGDYEESIQFSLKAAETAEKAGLERGVGSSFNNIALVYFEQKDHARSLEYFSKSLEIFERLNQLSEAAIVLSNMGAIYDQTGRHEEAIKRYQRAIGIHKSKGEDYGLGSDYINISLSLRKLGRGEEARQYLYEGYELKSKVKDAEGVAIIIHTLALLDMDKKLLEKSEKQMLRALEMADSVQSLTLQKEFTKSLSELYAKKNDFKKAFDFHLQFNRFQDSIFNIESTRQMNEMETKYKTGRVEKKLMEANRQKELDKVKHDSEMKQGRVITYSSIAGLVLMVFLAIMIFNRYQIKRKSNLELEQRNKEISARKSEIENQKNIIEEKNKDITDSIRYARRIQEALLPAPDRLSMLGEHFIYFQPRDIVSGDFYWIGQRNNSVLFAAADCTGHGVPGAFMSIVGHNLLHDSVTGNHISKPSEILDYLNQGLFKTLGSSNNIQVSDGMDIALCSLDRINMKLEYAGAYNSLWIIRNREVLEFPADKILLGNEDHRNSRFTNHEIDLVPGDMIYVFTDGYADQFGGLKGKKFKYRPMQDLLVKISEENCGNQYQSVSETMNSWKGNFGQVDDMLLMGVRI